MSKTNASPTPLGFTLVSALFLLWNLFGLAIFFMTIFLFTSVDVLTDAGLTVEQAEFTLATPAWVNIAFGVAVIFGVLGCVALVVKRKVAIPLLGISLLGVLVQNTYIYLLSDTIKVMGVGASPMVIVGAFSVLAFAIFGANKKWLR